ncbi:MAG TPA: SpoIVB peptidase S55 domain-containing protein [bacterium]|nr:SpoIVB peptidase S55 domain-containing protein [bacterium]
MARVVAVLVLAAALIVPAAGWAQTGPGVPPIMPIGEIKPGMRGTGRTVVKGQQVEDFTIEVIGILRGGGGIIPVRHLILFRVSGPVIDRTGGTAAGMSGSPLYINGKLFGALSAGYLFQPDKRDLALATPIEEMLRVLDLPAGSPQGAWPRTYTASAPLRIGGRDVNRVVIASTLDHARRIEAALPDTGAFIPTALFPETVSGLSGRSLRLLERGLEGIRGERRALQAQGGDVTDFTAAPIVGGSSVGVLQARGNLSFGGICTVTLRVGSKLLICGHPWDLLGDVEYALSTSDIITVVRTLERPFKEGNLGELIGKVDQDRGPAIRGVIGQMPRMFAVRVGVTDLDTGKRIDRGMQVVRRRDLAKLFATALTLEAIDRAREQVLGGGTATVTVTLRGKGLPRQISRKNLFYSSRDIAMASLLELPDALNFLFYNDLAAIDASDVGIDVTFATKRVTAAVTDVQVERREVAPGETLRVRLQIRPFQEAAVLSRVIDVAVPRNFPRGPAVLLVRSAGTENPADLPLEQRLLREPEPSPVNSLDDAIQLFEDFGKNTDVLIRLVPFGLPAEGPEFLKFDVFAGRIIRTDWVVQGSVEIPILVR